MLDDQSFGQLNDSVPRIRLSQNSAYFGKIVRVQVGTLFGQGIFKFDPILDPSVRPSEVVPLPYAFGSGLEG